PADAHAAHRLGGTGRHCQRCAVPGVGRGPVHHRCDAAGRRRQLPEVTIAELSIPQGWEAIDAEWMTAALGRHFPGATVGRVTVATRDGGTNRRARLEPACSAGTRPATPLAKTLDAE